MASNAKPAGRNRKLWTIVAAVIVVVVLVASIAYLANRSGSAPPPPTGPNVAIWDTGFCSNPGNCGYSPTSKTATNGTGLTWTNTGSQPHTVTECTTSDSSTACPNGAGSNNSASRAFDSNTQFTSGFRKDLQFSFTFSLGAGTYYYYCTLHAWMHGAVVVG